MTQTTGDYRASKTSLIDRSGCNAHHHGDRNAYNYYKCRCPDARQAETDYQRNWRHKAGYNQPVSVDKTGTVRRIQALIRMGHMPKDIAADLGWIPSRISDILNDRHPGVRPRTRDQVKAYYEKKQLVRGNSTKTMRWAIKRNWAPPLAWDEETIDDPNARPQGMIKRPSSTFQSCGSCKYRKGCALSDSCARGGKRVRRGQFRRN